MARPTSDRPATKCTHSDSVRSCGDDHTLKGTTKVEGVTVSAARTLMGRLEGKVAVVTGANSGIGLATAKRFAHEGARLFINGRRQRELDAATREVGGNTIGVKGDVANLADLDRLYEVVREAAGVIDILFANAGGGEFVPLQEITEDHYDRNFATNVKGTLSPCRRRFRSCAMERPSSSPAPRQLSKADRPSVCTARARRPSEILREAGVSIWRRGVSESTCWHPARPQRPDGTDWLLRRSSIGKCKD